MSKLKRLAAPAYWPIEAKTKKYVIKPKPGPHTLETSMPLGVVIRDVMKHAETLREVKTILNKGLVKIDGRTRKDHGFPVGFMDVIELGDDAYRVLAGKNGLYMKPVQKGELFKLARVEDKRHLGKGKIQLSLHDGTNIIAAKDEYKTGDVLVMETGKQVKEVLRFEKGAAALIMSGRNMGALVRIKKIIITKSSHPNIVVVTLNGQDVPVPKGYVFVVGKEAPAISLDGGQDEQEQ
ncbi:MAG: 30S ribosomal protein S4e [Candidatus Aenigmarchaeota archaeon]|nr:30S ribosomal protein S4e [Candidatus Aenigmarchaeota archaeon]